mmetsp:Transcript_15821/g.32513  ORF Transcript_15821/g.32513 Transcript_15821/m.32513 type:complete len:220 (+) Transcript_15821:395-1054(+)
MPKKLSMQQPDRKVLSSINLTALEQLSKQTVQKSASFMPSISTHVASTIKACIWTDFGSASSRSFSPFPSAFSPWPSPPLFLMTDLMARRVFLTSSYSSASRSMLPISYFLHLHIDSQTIPTGLSYKELEIDLKAMQWPSTAGLLFDIISMLVTSISASMLPITLPMFCNFVRASLESCLLLFVSTPYRSKLANRQRLTQLPSLYHFWLFIMISDFPLR